MKVISIAIPNSCDADKVRAELEASYLEKYGTDQEKKDNAVAVEPVIVSEKPKKQKQ